ncbi:MAG: Rieske 2Fe-2S domain-containing protein, partial [Chloroflexi bacterium]|nr:Rieske 2Fe-2S domain-containing protein [Chloroflexota bacterium]
METHSRKLPKIAPGVPEGLELGLRNYWYPLLPSEELGQKPIATRALGEDLVVWRGGDGIPHVFADVCPHRAARLSLGTVQGEELQCIFHGLRFDGSGRCTRVPWEPPSSPVQEEVPARSYPSFERSGLIFAYLGDAAQYPPPDPRSELPAELWDERSTGFVLTETWVANWLNATDGSDLFHVPILHAQSAIPPESRGQAPAQLDVKKSRDKWMDLTVRDAQGNE